MKNEIAAEIVEPTDDNDFFVMMVDNGKALDLVGNISDPLKLYGVFKSLAGIEDNVQSNASW